MSQTPKATANLAELAKTYLDVLVQAEQVKDPSSLIQFLSPGVYAVRPAIDAPFQQIVVTCDYYVPASTTAAPANDVADVLVEEPTNEKPAGKKSK